MGKQLDNRVEKVVEVAQEAFWREVVKQFPEVITGDLDPYSATLFTLACEDVIKNWYQNNNIVMEFSEKPYFRYI